MADRRGGGCGSARPARIGRVSVRPLQARRDRQGRSHRRHRGRWPARGRRAHEARTGHRPAPERPGRRALGLTPLDAHRQQRGGHGQCPEHGPAGDRPQPRRLDPDAHLALAHRGQREQGHPLGGELLALLDPGADGEDPRVGEPSSARRNGRTGRGRAAQGAGPGPAGPSRTTSSADASRRRCSRRSADAR